MFTPYVPLSISLQAAGAAEARVAALEAALAQSSSVAVSVSAQAAAAVTEHTAQVGQEKGPLWILVRFDSACYILSSDIHAVKYTLTPKPA